MTHEERAARRKQIAEYVRERLHEHDPCGGAAQAFGVGLHTVYNACDEHGVPRPKKTGNTGGEIKRPGTLAIIARLCIGDETLTEIAESVGITKQRVSQIYTEARDAGIPVRVRAPGVNRSK